ncbi:MAG TPA: nicotinate (nicotinamide) nucleotide adenylyltransferase [Bacteroidales bacterium]|nr:nicotinate (nicotinamide) nucleotide adenylyltransferase [Bacteroidales bacterium]
MPAPIRTALFGGSFNPIHEGHLALADYVLSQGFADEVWFVVSPQNPLKPTADASDAIFRLEGVRHALTSHPGCIASDIEFDLPLPSYSVQTLRKAVTKYPSRKFLLLIGGDNLDAFTQWKDYQFLLDHFDTLVYPRPGASNQVPKGWNRVHMLNAPMMDISSTALRKGINLTD